MAPKSLPGDSPDLGTKLLERFHFVLIATQLHGAARRIISGIKSQNHLVAAAPGKGEVGLLRLPVHHGGSRQSEVGRDFAKLRSVHEEKR